MNFCHVTMPVNNLDESLHFYRDILGLPVRWRFSPTPGADIAFLCEGETQIELIESAAAPAPVEVASPGISLCFAVESLQDTQKLLCDNGITPDDMISPVPEVVFFFATDPNGVKIQFIAK